MTTEEKWQAVEEYCESKKNCCAGEEHPCPLFIFNCDNYDMTDEFFKLVSAMPDYKGKQDMSVYSAAADEEINKAMAELKKTERVNHPSHYQGKHECIDEMIALFGVEAVKHFCMCNVYKYRYRAANKNGQEDLDKADWYMDKLMELEGKHD